MSGGSAAEVARKRLERFPAERRPDESRVDARCLLPAEPRPPQHLEQRWTQAQATPPSTEEEFVVDWALGVSR